MSFELVFSILLLVGFSFIVNTFIACYIYHISKAVNFLALVQELRGGYLEDERALEEDESED